MGTVARHDWSIRRFSIRRPSDGAISNSEAWLKSNSNNEPHPLGGFPPNKHGFYDLIGNVAEWVITDSDTPQGKVIGGSYMSSKSDLKDSIIIRTSVLYFNNGNCFVNNIIDKIINRKVIKVVNDQFSTPTYAGDLARVILKIIPFIKSDKADIYHFANIGECTRFDIAVKINKILNGKSAIYSSKSENAKTQRPFYSVLDSKKIIKKFNLRIRNWEEALNDYILKQNIELNEI